jgi:CheY-like chemotaxis protein
MRLSRTLHDGLQQHLFSAKLRVGGLADGHASEETRQAVVEIEHILDEAAAISRSLSAELSPPILHEGGLAEGLEWLSRWMREKFKFNVVLQLEARPVLDEDVKAMAFESVRELLMNALKHAAVDDATVGMAMRDPSRLQILVSDQGVGFDPLRASSPVGENGGFGLFSIRERIGLIGGEFRIESSSGSGSRFTLTLPAALPPAEPRFPDREPDPKSSGDAGTPDGDGIIRVLLADDHALFLEGMDRMLSRSPDIRIVGHARNGLEAIEMADGLMPQVILMDVSMPVVDGIEATRAIHATHPRICIIGLSMYEDLDRAQAMRAAGASHYKTKGCVITELIAAVRGCRTRD